MRLEYNTARIHKLLYWPSRWRITNRARNGSWYCSPQHYGGRHLYLPSSGISTPPRASLRTRWTLVASSSARRPSQIPASKAVLCPVGYLSGPATGLPPHLRRYPEAVREWL